MAEHDDLRLAEQRQAERTTAAIEWELQLAEAGSRQAAGQVARELYADHVLPIRYQLGHTRLEREDLRTRLAAANERADTAEARLATQVGNVRELATENEQLRARLAEIGETRPLGVQWSTENTYAHPDDSIVDRDLAKKRVTAHPLIHSNVLTRKLYAGPWLRAGGVVTADATADGHSGTEAGVELDASS